MSHIERKNPSDVYPPYNNVYTQVIRAKGTVEVHVAGTVSLDIHRNLVGEGDMRLQTKTTMENIGRSLVAFGAKPSDVVRVNIFTLDVDRYLQEGHQELVAFFGQDTLPTSTLVGCTRLADPRYLVEIEATAILTH